MSAQAPPSPAVVGMPRLLLGLEGGAACAGAAWLYGQSGFSWWIFAALFLAPDLAMLGYLSGPRIGAIAYNLAHTYAAPAVLALAGLAGGPILLALAAIWAAHIGFDRALGYGLKYPSRFKDTHLSTA